MEDILKRFQTMKYLFETEGYNKLFVDLSQQEKIPDVDKILSTFPAEFTGLNIALYHLESTKTVSKVGEILNEKRNDFNFKFFINKEEAITWLKSI